MTLVLIGKDPRLEGSSPQKNTQNSGFHSVQGIWYHPSLILEPLFFLGGGFGFFHP